jgi:NAD(P)-dependent dehydrogenase (short-subunit alcohol dehydrogenase family)
MSQVKYDFSGKNVLVVGGTTGIGRATALAFAGAGANLFVSGLGADHGRSLGEEVKAIGREFEFREVDVRNGSAMKRLHEEAYERFGRIDVAFNNAGTEGEFTPFVDQSNEVYDTIFNANVRGVFWSMKHEAKAMLAQGGGTIINNASMGGVIGFGNAGLYIASKHAVLGLTKTASIELFRQGVRVNAICPGIIDTPFQDRIWPSPGAKNAFAASTVPGRAGSPEEIATVVAFLASDDASFVSGHGLLADGGYVIA